MTAVPSADATTYTAGDRVYRWWESNRGKNDSWDPQPLTVVRVNRCTITVRTDQGSTFRMDPHDIAGYYIDDDADDPAPLVVGSPASIEHTLRTARRTQWEDQ